MNIAEFKQNYPQYKNVNDQDLAIAVHSKYYPTTDFDSFSKAFGVVPPSDDQEESSFIRELGTSLVRETMQIGKGVVGTAESGLNLLSPQTKIANELDEIQDNITKAQGKFAPQGSGTGEWAGRLIGGAVPQLGYALVGGKYLGVFGAAAAGFTLEGQRSYERAKNSNASESEAQLERVIGGTVGGILNAIQVGNIFKLSKAGKGSLRGIIEAAKAGAKNKLAQEGIALTSTVLKSSVNNAIQEAIQEGASLSIPSLLRGDYPKTEAGLPDWVEIGNQLGEAALAGGVVGGATTFALSGASTIQDVAGPSPERISSIRKRIKEGDYGIVTKNRMLNTLEEFEVEAGLRTREDLEASRLQRPEEFQKFDAARKKLVEKTKEVPRLRRGEAKDISIERGKRFSEAEEFRKDANLSDAEAERFFRSQMKGQLKRDFVPLEDQFSSDELNTLTKSIRESELLGGEYLNAMDGFRKLIYKGEIPSKSETKIMSKVFGPDFVKALMSKRSAGQKIFDGFVDAFNLPRALVASIDASAMGNQGWLMLPIAPKEWAKAVGTGYRALANPKFAKQIELEIETDSFYQTYKKNGGEISKIGDIDTAEEAFISRFASKIPGIRRSEAAYTASLNDLRFSTFKKIMKDWEGTTKTGQDVKDLVSFIKHATGKGDIGVLKNYNHILNAVFFSPKLNFGRIQTVTDLMTKGSAVRKLAARDLITGVSAGVAVLALISQMKGVTVESDPRSSDFGRIRYGNTRIDFWGGYSPMVRFVVRMITGDIKTTNTKRVYSKDRLDIAKQFLRTKLSPGASIAVDTVTGETLLGEDFKPFEGKLSVEQIWNHSAPLFLQDVVDGLRYQGLKETAIISPLAFNGISAMTYPIRSSTEVSMQKNREAQELFGVPWDELGPEAQKAIRENTSSIGLLEEKARRERTDFDFLSDRIKEELEAGKKVLSKLPKSVQNDMNILGVDIGNLSRNLSKGWYLNQKRYDDYQRRVSQLLGIGVNNLYRLPRWKTADPLLKKTAFEELIKEAKDIVKKQLIQEATINDLEHRRDIMRKKK